MLKAQKELCVHGTLPASPAKITYFQAKSQICGYIIKLLKCMWDTHEMSYRKPQSKEKSVPDVHWNKALPLSSTIQMKKKKKRQSPQR